MDQPTPFEAVIVGAGLIGATLAIALAQAGLKVAVVDSAPLGASPDADGRASAIAYANWRLWRALGVSEMLEAHAQPITAIRLIDSAAPGASMGAAFIAGLQFNAADARAEDDPSAPLGWMVENRHIRAALDHALTDSGVALFAPATMVATDTAGPLAQVRLGDGASLSAPVIVGADGRASRVRQAAAIGVNGWTYGQTGVAATVALGAPHGGVAYQFFLPGGPLAVLPLTGDRASLVWTEQATRAAALMEASPDAFEAHLTRRFGEQLRDNALGGCPRLIGSRFGYPLQLQLAETLTARRTALVGDAAHVLHPIAGQGLNLGLKDVAALAEVLVDARRLGEDMGAEAVLARYARWRRFDAASLAMTTDLLNRLFSNDHPALRALRGAGMALVDRIGPAKRVFMRDAGAELGDLPRLLRGHAL